MLLLSFFRVWSEDMVKFFGLYKKKKNIKKLVKYKHMWTCNYSNSTWEYDKKYTENTVYSAMYMWI